MLYLLNGYLTGYSALCVHFGRSFDDESHQWLVTQVVDFASSLVVPTICSDEAVIGYWMVLTS